MNMAMSENLISLIARLWSARLSGYCNSLFSAKKIEIPGKKDYFVFFFASCFTIRAWMPK
jgi:hypothetical protein